MLASIPSRGFVVPQQAFQRSLDSLEAVFRFTEGCLAEEKIDHEHHFPVQLAIEELFVNMVKYNSRGAADILVEIQRADDRLIVVLTDEDSDPFDVTAMEEPDVDLPLEERRPGGLGIMLARKVMDEIAYEHAGRRSTIRLVKNLG
jgi:serine/threonine-protein kinase RsbW